MPLGALGDRHGVAAHLTDLAAEPGLASRRDELTALADALRGIGTSDLEPWTELDLIAAYARPESVHEALRPPPQPRYLAWVEAALGALVFVPLLLTWFGLTRASSAYDALTQAEPKQAERPFLQLWQTGFEGHLTGWFTFGHVVASATAVIACLLLLALLHGWGRAAADRAEEQARHDGEQLLARLLPVLTRAQLLLNEERLGSPARFAAELGKSAANLNRLTSKAVSTQERLTKASEQVGAAVRGAERRLAGVDAAVAPLEQAAAGVAKAVLDSGARMNGALGDVREVNGEIRDRLDRAGERVEDAVTVLAASQRSFTTSTEVAADVTAQTLTRLGEVAEQSALAVTAAQDTARRIAEQTDALHAMAESVTELATSVRATEVRDSAVRAAPAPVADLVPSAPGWPGVHDDEPADRPKAADPAGGGAP
ncbi:methyl-accepting chemotaxis protein [Streptomyces sp. CMB-StM0423]|uniref:methyl-accepting chemotaxis protein n=1 Tax=Streptomyces sp. CMB-StM0423 TaxID=2059884 RepID=UPI001F2954B1|nr:methyl-accepting chemotaxis protein [Streptomyces sp. CMB-StM0423]